MELIQALKNLSMTARNQIYYYYDKWYNQAVSLAATKLILGNLCQVKRIARRQTTRNNHPATAASEYYKRTITIPVLDQLNLHLETRFDFSSVSAMLILVMSVGDRHLR